MRYAADLHLHSHYAEAVSPQMTLETMARYARRKGIDVMATGDCLQPEWLRELEAKLEPAEAGWFRLRREIDEGILEELPDSLRRPLRFVLSTEVHCAPRGTGRLEGIHHLIYFPDFTDVRRLRERIKSRGDLQEGRPRLDLSSREMLEMTLENEDACHFAPAHVMNPYFSTLGSVMGHRNLEEVFGGSEKHLLAVEMGLTSIPPMGRRISSLDRHALFANSDAHSPENIGRECTILETAPGYAPMFAALHRGSPEDVVECIKFSIYRTRYFLNWCGQCQAPWEGTTCPRGHGRLVTGSRDWLERIADREEASGVQRFQMYVPLKSLLGEFRQLGLQSKVIGSLHEHLLRQLGSERHILTESSFEEIAAASSGDLAAVVVGQRSADHREPFVIKPPAAQAELF